MPRFDDDAIFERPAEVLGSWGEQIKDELRQEYKAEQAQRTFWTEFYERNADLRAHSDMVNMVFQEGRDLLEMTSEQAVVALAGRTRAKIKWLERTREQREEAAMYVGGPGLEGKPAIQQGFDAPKPLGETISERRERRRQAQRGFRREVA